MSATDGCRARDAGVRVAADAQDLVQESLIAAFSGRARFGSVEQAEAYVRRAIASRAIDAGRRRTREARLMARAAAQAPERPSCRGPPARR